MIYVFSIDIPILLHCSAGVGRTGTVIAIDRVKQALTGNTLPRDFTVKSLVKHLRQSRPKMVQVTITIPNFSIAKLPFFLQLLLNSGFIQYKMFHIQTIDQYKFVYDNVEELLQLKREKSPPQRSGGVKSRHSQSAKRAKKKRPESTVGSNGEKNRELDNYGRGLVRAEMSSSAKSRSSVANQI